jgi:acyl-CoA synthetase (AMP-forming)/AMP-acid ligase II
MNLTECWVRTARRLPNAPALLSGKEVVADYTEFARRVAGLASAMQAHFGVGPGDRVVTRGLPSRQTDCVQVRSYPCTGAFQSEGRVG